MALGPRVALFRAVNVGGTGLVAMADLRAMLADLGFARPRSLLQSGNLVFDAEAAPAELETQLEAEARRRFGLATEVMARDRAQWAALIAANPYARMAADDPSHLLVYPLKTEPAAGAMEALRAAIVGPETAALAGRTLYVCYPDGVGHSKLTHAMIERRLGVRGTGRNWNTVTRLSAMLEG